MIGRTILVSFGLACGVAAAGLLARYLPGIGLPLAGGVLLGIMAWIVTPVRKP